MNSNLTPQQREMARETILPTLKLEKINLTEHEIELLIDDLGNLVEEAGGDFTKANLRFYLLEYIKTDFLRRFKFIHKND